MSQHDGFGSGFLIGALFGGIVGGVVGVVATSKVNKHKETRESQWLEDDASMPFDTEESMEVARRRLESKIAQLNGAIDDVRQQMTVIHFQNGQEPPNS